MNCPRHPRPLAPGDASRLAVMLLVICAIAASAGCRTYHQLKQTAANDTHAVDRVMKRVDAPPKIHTVPDAGIQPLTIEMVRRPGELTYWDITLDEAVSTALSNSRVLRDLGATVLRSPETIGTRFEHPLQLTDPQRGMEGALSAFDAQFDAFGTFQNNDRRFNNRFFGGGANAFKQDLHDYVFQVRKRTATGAEMAVRSITDYDANNATGNLTNSAWQTQLHVDIVQPILQGGGLTFNRIAGPFSAAGAPNGVLIAKVDNDITEAEFRKNVRNFVSDVANAYWDLYFAYRDLDARSAALDRARETWQSFQAQRSANRRAGAAEALAREQYYRFESELQDAIAGRLTQRTQLNNGLTSGNFAAVPGVQAAERRLRLIMGLPINDGRSLRPAEEPPAAPVTFDWEAISLESLQKRIELHQQELRVRRRELEVLAAKNYLLPQLDLFARYRVRGLDQQLAGDNSAFRQLGEWDHQEYEGGFEFSVPIGFRQGHATVQNARLKLARERAVLFEQQRQILHDLSAATVDVDRAFNQIETNLNRYLAAGDALDALEANRQAGLPVNLEQLLDAQRRLTEAQSRYYQARTAYAVALKNVAFEKGTLLENHGLCILDPELDL